MNILIIGGTNFIGWKLVELLHIADKTVIVVNRGNKKKQYPNNTTHIALDRNDYGGMISLLKEQYFDVVFDMCAFNGNDMKHTIDLFDKKVGKYVFISSAATYLEPAVLPINEDFEQGIHPVWGIYGNGKLECERILLDAYKEKGFPAIIVRPSYVYGIGNTIDRETFLFDRITKGRTILMPGYGESVIQLGEVTDLCEALIKIAELPGGIGNCYNISGNEYLTLKGLVDIIALILKKDPKIVYIDPRKYGMKDRDIFPFDNSTYFTSCKKYSNEFNWEPKVSLMQGLSLAYNFWVNSESKIKTKYEKEDVVLTDLLSHGII